MKRRLWLLNVVLLVVLLVLGHVLRQHWQEAHLREQKILDAKIRPAEPQYMPTRPMVQKLQPTTYVDVAQKVLFARDRNPDVIPDPPKPPPPPPPVPPFPVAHGVMILGDVPPTIILSANAKAEQQAYRAGDKVGEFEIASINDRQVIFTWDGKTFVKNISDLEAADTTPANQQQTQNTAPPVQNTPPPPVAQTPAEVISTQSGPLGGRDLMPDGKTKSCQQSDPNPTGAVVDGYRKVMLVNPLAPSAPYCQWQSVN